MQHGSIYIIVVLIHWGWVTHICISKLTIVASGNDLAPSRRQAIIWTNAGILLIGPLGTNFSEILIEIHTFSFKKMHLKMSSGKWHPFCLGLNMLNATMADVVIRSHFQLKPYMVQISGLRSDIESILEIIDYVGLHYVTKYYHQWWCYDCPCRTRWCSVTSWLWGITITMCEATACNWLWPNWVLQPHNVILSWI